MVTPVYFKIPTTEPFLGLFDRIDIRITKTNGNVLVMFKPTGKPKWQRAYLAPGEKKLLARGVWATYLQNSQYIKVEYREPF